MKGRRLLALVALACTVQSVRAQTPPTPEIATYAGLTITGTTGSVYTVEATEDPTQIEGWSVVGLFRLKPGPNLWVDTAIPVAGKRFYRAVEAAVQPVANMVFISPGTFVMGSPNTEVGRSANEGPQTQVTLNKGFYMGKYEVTQAEYLAVMGSNPSTFTGNSDGPVETVSWNGAVAYCAALTTAERAAGRCPADWSYRLPTEAEWEYACRAGTTTRFSYGDDDTLLSNYAWYSVNSSSTTNPVGQKLPNAWGLYDMHGNVFEWCMDSWDGSANYPGGSVTDPLVTTGSGRVLRGGDWGGIAISVRCAFRGSNFAPDYAYSYYGFRAVLAPSQ